MGMRAWIAAATGLALVLRLLGLGADSLWGDEAFTWHATTLPWGEVAKAAGDANCPGYYLLAKAFTGVLGDGEAVLRLPAALLMAAAVPFIALLALRMGGEGLGAIVAAFVAALSSALVHYGQEARAYALLVFASAATLVAFSRTIDMGTGGVRPRVRDAVALGLAATLLLYAHPFGVLEVAGLGIYVLARWVAERRCPRASFLGLALAGALFAPFVHTLLLRAQRVAEGFWIRPAGFVAIARVPGKLLHSGGGDLVPLLLAPLAIAACVRLPRPWCRLTLAIALACWIAPAVYGHFGRPIFVERYTLGLAPPVVAAIGCLVARAARRRPRRGLVAGAAILAGMAAGATAYHATRPHRPDWRTGFSELERAAEEGATPVAAGFGAEQLAGYYLRAKTVVVLRAEVDGDRVRVGPLPPGRIAILAPPWLRDAILEACEGRAILRELPRRRSEDQLFLEIR